MFPLLVEAVYPCAAFAALPEPLSRDARRQARQQVFAQTLRSSGLLQLLARLEGEGVRPLVMKGILCRELYPVPEARPSADEDLLVREEDFLPTVELLKEFGYRPLEESAGADAYEMGFLSPEGLHIELHRQPFDPASQRLGKANALFARVHGENGRTRMAGVSAMPPHEHMLYLLLHAFKHLIHRGFGLRQMCDILLWGERYRDEINWQKLEEQCAALRAWDFARAVFVLGREVFGIVLPADCTGMESAADALLEDMFTGGIYGGESLSRKHSAGITLAATEGNTPLLATLFPGREKLVGRYPWLRRYPVLLPAAWAARLAGYAFRERGGEDSAADSVRIGRERTALLRKLNVID